MRDETNLCALQLAFIGIFLFVLQRSEITKNWRFMKERDIYMLNK